MQKLHISAVVLFDLLYLNGKPFFGAPLHQRLEMLKIAPLKKEREDTIFVAKHEEGSKKFVESIHNFWVFINFFSERTFNNSLK